MVETNDEMDAKPPEAEELHQSPLEEMLEEASPPVAALLQRLPGVTDSLVGEVTDDRHPSLRGRVRVRWSDLEGQIFEKWLPTLHGLPVRVSDRVLLTQPSNWPEYVVTGVIDGFARRPDVDREERASLELKRDEVLRVRSQSGEDLLELFDGESGPVVRLLTPDVDIDLPGKLRVRASSIELEAKRGQVRITASDDVIVRGETVHLN